MADSFKIYSAPLQGYTDCTWRSAHSEIFGGVDVYCAPFLRLEHGKLMRRDIRDIAPENNAGVNVTPQIIACSAADATRLVEHLKSVGYSHIDVNMGCPFPPIASHRKGCGILPYPDEVKAMCDALAAIYGVTYSFKMRLGWTSPDEWRAVLPIIEAVNPTQITVHPRIGRQQYKGEMYLDEFAAFAGECHVPLMFNGDITHREHIDAVRDRFPTICGVMIGRGLVADPAMLTPNKATPDRYASLHDRVFEAASQMLDGGERQLLVRMKSFWELFLPNADHKARKLIKKATTVEKYNGAVTLLFQSL